MSLLRNRSLLAATLGHFSVDMYSGMLPLILLALTDPLGLTYFQVGLVSMIVSITSSISQPLFGWLGDKQYNRALAVGGVATISVAMGLMRFADNFSILLLLAPIAGLGSGAFHPQGAVLASQTPPRMRGSAMSVFMLGGNSGFAIGPLLGSFAFVLAGDRMREMFAIVGLAQAALIYWIMAEHQQAHAEKTISIAKSSAMTVAVSAVIMLAAVIFFRSWVSQTVSTYIPQVYKTLGFSNTYAGNVLFSILLPLAIGGLIGGTLSDRIGRKWVLVISTALVAPALYALVEFPGPLTFILGPLFGIAIGASFPVTLVMAQQIIPRGRGVMSGFVLGFTFIAGAIGVSVSGVLADVIGLLPTMTVTATLPILAAFLAVFLPEDRATATPTKFQHAD